MKRVRALLRKLFGFSRTETNAFLVLLPLMALVLFSEPTYRWWLMQETPDLSADSRTLDSLIATLRFTKSQPDSITTGKPEFHPFNPNKAGIETLEKTGLSRYLATRLVRFREKGGVFRKKEDLLKIYGMDTAWFVEARRWIVLPEADSSVKKISAKREFKDEPVDINITDSIQLLRVRGIGPVLSRRIRIFREKLGGFYSMEQLREVYGLDSAVVQQLQAKFFIAEGFQPRKIDLNHAELEDFLKHPYFRRNESRAILAFRLQHGPFQSLDELTQVKMLTPEWIEKVRPYLVAE